MTTTASLRGASTLDDLEAELGPHKEMASGWPDGVSLWVRAGVLRELVKRVREAEAKVAELSALSDPMSQEEYDRIFGCIDCGENTSETQEYPWMVSDACWASVGMRPDGMLCVACMEKRLGRQLLPADIVAGLNPTMERLFRDRGSLT